MTIAVHFYSYFKELTGCTDTAIELGEGEKIEALLKKLFSEYPKLTAMQNSMLIAVGLEYQGKSYVLKGGDKVSLFPPVQGG